MLSFEIQPQQPHPPQHSLQPDDIDSQPSSLHLDLDEVDQQLRAAAAGFLDGSSIQSILDDCNVFVKYLPPDLSDPEFYNLFKSYGPIISSKIMVDQGTGKSLGYGFVRYANSAASLRAIHHMNGQRVANKRLLCKLANLSPSSFTSEFAKHPLLNYQAPSDNIYIKPLLQDTSEDDLRGLFGKYGKIVDCKVMVDRNTGLSRQIGFVRFETKDEATLAIEEMNNYKLNPSAPPLTVKFADTKEQKTARKAIRQKQYSKPEPPLRGAGGAPLSPSPQAHYFYPPPHLPPAHPQLQQSSFEFSYPPQYSSFQPPSPYLFSDVPPLSDHSSQPPHHHPHPHHPHASYFPAYLSQQSSNHSPYLIYEYGSNHDEDVVSPANSVSYPPYEGLFSPIWNFYDSEEGPVPVPEGLGYNNYFVEEHDNNNHFNNPSRILTMDTSMDYFCPPHLRGGGSLEEELDNISEDYLNPSSDDYLILGTPQ